MPDASIDMSTEPPHPIVGRWEVQPVTTFEFRDDFTLSWTSQIFPPGTMRTSPGDWALEGSSVTVHADLGQIVTVGLRVIPDIVIGSELLLRDE